MARLPEDPRSQRRILGILLLAAGAVGFELLVHRPGRTELAAAERRVEELARRNELERSRTGELDRRRAELESAERQLGDLQSLVPMRAETAEIYEEVATRAEAVGLELVSVTPSRDEAEAGAFYRRLRWELVVEGGSHDLGLFLARMASLPRLVRPEVRRIEGLERAGVERHPVRATVTLETFVLADEVAPLSVGSRERRAAGGARAAGSGSAVLPDREVFDYPVGDRRDPFRPSVAGGRSGPDFGDLRLRGILFAPEVGSVAVLRDAATGRLHRLREGDRLGNVRLVELGPAVAVFSVSGPAGHRREILRLDSGARGGP